MDSHEPASEGEYCWGHDLSLLSQLRQQVICRDSQLNLLLSLLGERSHMTPASIFMYGHTATGKSYIMETMLTTLKLPSVWVNCIECYSARYLYEHVLNNLPSAQGDKPTAQITCDNMNDFIRLLKAQVEGCSLQNETLYIVLDRAERLRDMDANILPAFLRLQELTKLNICTILLSDILWEKFRFGTGFCEPFTIYLPDFSQDELKRIMLLDCPKDQSESLYMNYVSLFLSVFYYVCRDLRELRHMALLNFPKYVEPLEKKEVTEKDSGKLWRNIEPHLKKALHTVYLREVSSTQWEQMQKSHAEDENGVCVPSVPASRNHVELPYYSKYLLVAAYIASYNPVVSDKRFFCKKSGKISKRSKLMKKHERASNHLLGPKPFPLDRLLAIFYSIVEEKIAPSAIIFSQISSLVSLHLLGQTCSDSQIEMPRYKCLVSLDFIRSVARTIGFDVMKYLYDFM
ncbi:origin recognition complex subunit 5-like [Babylonia areolata]|uniref:origin recognition complex subunit 5-like n=1 Tax=Babylonia areolata TaxID=304850 RepID=UPI003FCFFD02